MKRTVIWVVICVAGCASSDTTSRELDQHVIAQCRADDEKVIQALYPDPTTIALHAALERRIALLQQTAIAQKITGEEFRPIAEEIAQARVEADALFDVRAKQQIANECWERLAGIRGIQKVMEQREAEMANEISTHRMTSQAAPGQTPVFSAPGAPNPSPVGTIDSNALMPMPSAPPPRFIPYEEVAPTMPGIGPDGTVK